MLLRALVALALRQYPAKEFTHAGASKPYMRRYYLLGGPDHLRPGSLVRVYINHILRSDSTRELHNHPWSWAVSLILKGGYTETLFDGQKRRFRPGMLNFIRGGTFHRIEIPAWRFGKTSWSLFLVPGKSSQEWGFLDRETGKYRPAKPLNGAGRSNINSP
jgi:hypothetical protein